MSSGDREGLCDGRARGEVNNGTRLMFQGHQGDDVTLVLQALGSIEELIQAGDALTVNGFESFGSGSIG